MLYYSFLWNIYIGSYKNIIKVIDTNFKMFNVCFLTRYFFSQITFAMTNFLKYQITHCYKNLAFISPYGWENFPKIFLQLLDLILKISWKLWHVVYNFTLKWFGEKIIATKKISTHLSGLTRLWRRIIGKKKYKRNPQRQI